MAISIEAIIWYAFLVDSIFANIFSWCCPRWYAKKYKGFSRVFPLTKGWTLLYFVLIVWIGYALYRLGILPM